MYPTPLSLGRRIVKLSPEIWVVHGEKPTQWLGFTIIYWVTYPIPSSSLKACFAENVGKWRNLKCILIRNLHLLHKNNAIVAKPLLGVLEKNKWCNLE